MFDLGLRSLSLFFRDRTAAGLSFLAEFILAGLYFLFIRNRLVGGFSQLEDAELLMDAWMACGLLGVTPLTAAMGAYGVLVEDRARRIDRDFGVSPLRKGSLAGGYLLGAVAVGLLASFVILLGAETYIAVRYGVRLGSGRMARVCGILLLAAMSDAAQMLLAASLLSSGAALAACCTVVGSLVGFLTGIYLPVGSMPETVRWVVTWFPPSHGAALLRQTLLEPLLSGSFGGAETQAARQFEEYLGVRYVWRGARVSPEASVRILLAAGAVCLVLAVWRLSRPQRT